MATKVPPQLAQDVALLDATLRPRLTALGVERVEIAAAGPKGKAQFWIGYQLATGAHVTKGQIRETVSVHWPAAVDYHSMQVVPSRTSHRPSTTTPSCARRRRCSHDRHCGRSR